MMCSRPGRLVPFLAFLFALGLPGQPPQGDLEAHIGKGYQLVQQDRFEQAAAEFQRALSLDPGLPRIRYQLAVCLFALGRREESERQFQLVERDIGADPKILYYLGRLRLLALDNEAAVAALRKIAEHPPFPDAAFYLGCAYLAKGDIREAISAFERAAANAPRDYRIPYRLARAYRQAGRLKEAESEYQRSSDLRQHYNTAAGELTECAIALKTRPLDAARTVCQRMADPNDPDKLTSLAIVYGENGAYTDALGPLEKAADLDPDSFEVFHNLGLSYFRLRRFREARPALERAVDLRPDFFGSNALLGAVLFALKEDQLAYPVLLHAHQLQPRDPDTADLALKVALLLARGRFVAKDYPHAIEYLLKASEIRPADASVHRRLAEVYAALGQQDRAAQETAKAKASEGPR